MEIRAYTTEPLALYTKQHLTDNLYHGTAIAVCYHITRALDKRHRHHTTLSDDGQNGIFLLTFL